MDYSEIVESKVKQILNKLMQINAVKSFKLTIKWGKKNDLVKVDFSGLNVLLDECLKRIILKPRRAEIRNVISELVKKKNDSEFFSDNLENSDALTENDTFYCNDCNLEFENYDGYADHVRSHGDSNFEFSDRNRNRNSASDLSNLGRNKAKIKKVSKNHDLTEKGSKPFLCEYCGKQFFQISVWKSHLLIAHTSDKNLKCEKCGLLFSIDSGQKKAREKENSYCQACLKAFPLENLQLQDSIPVEQSEKIERSKENRVIANRKRLTENKSKFSPIEFNCSYCDKSFKTKGALRTHFSQEHQDLTCRKENCAWFGLKFRTKKEYQIHVSSDCKILPNSFSCTYADCDKVYKRLKDLKNHVKLKHLPEKTSFPCHICSKVFFEKGKLTRHVDSHNEHKFQCDLCSKSFTRGDVLKRHKNLLHEKRKMFSCKYCQKTFSLKYNRDCHQDNVHVDLNGTSAEFNCEICSKKLRNKSSYRMHMKVHQEKKNFSCSLCGKTFIRQVHYQKHMKSRHFGISPFQNLLDSFAADEDCN